MANIYANNALNQWLLKHGAFQPGAPGLPRKFVPAPSPPMGTYDPSLDYNAGAADRGYHQTLNDAETQYAQGQQDYGLGLGNLLTQHDRAAHDLNLQMDNVRRNYQILGHQQSDAAAAHGITSGGLLALSASRRADNQAHDLSPLQEAQQRNNEDYTNQKNLLSLQNARQFGGFEGNVLTDPFTGQPIFGTLATGVARAGAENTAYQNAINAQKIYGAQQGGYIAPQTAALDRARAAATKRGRRR